MRENRKADTAALSIATVMCGIIAMGAIPQWLTIIGIAATLMFMSCTIYVAFAGRKPKPQLATSDPQPRQLATTAQDEAAKAADLGLPTGVWTDLAATWTTWADQDDADKPTEAPEEPVKRLTPPAGGGGAGHVPWVVDAPPGTQADVLRLIEAIARNKPVKSGALRRGMNSADHGSQHVSERHLGPIDTVRGSSFRIYRATCGYCGDAVEDTSKDKAIATMRALHESCRERSEPAKCSDLPQVKATAPPSDTVIVGDERMTLPPATTGYSTLIVYRNEDPSAGFWQSPEDPTRTNHWHVRRVIQVPAGTTSYQNLRLGDPDEVRTIARIDMPPNTSTVAPRQITDLRQG